MKKTLIQNTDIFWEDRAACKDAPDYEDFYSTIPNQQKAIIAKYCANCAVKNECLEYAIANNEHFGIWGGMNEASRRKLQNVKNLGVLGVLSRKKA